MERNSGAKRQLFPDHGKQTEEQPATKTVKREEAESNPSQEVLDLQEKVAELENKFAGACRIASEYETRLHEAKARVEFLENLIDKKPQSVEKDDEKEELKKKVHSLEQQLDTERKRAAEELKNKVGSVTLQLLEDMARDKERIAELTRKYEDGVGALQQLQHQQSPSLPSQSSQSVSSAARSDEHYTVMERVTMEHSTQLLQEQKKELPRSTIGHPTNIFERYDGQRGDEGLISYADASMCLRTRIRDCGEKKVNEHFAKDKTMRVECSFCGMRVEKKYVFGHFLSDGHGRKIGKHAHVSRAAFDYWFGELRKVEAAADEAKHLAVLAAEPAAAVAVMEAKMELDEDVDVICLD